MQCFYLTSVVDPKKFPKPGLPEIAFVGRSNVGKSSLLNAIANQKHLARTSRTPGRTQMVNFFVIPERGFFVDLPGYGFAKNAAHLRNRWQASVDVYFRRPSVALICFLVDCRRGVIDEDLDLLDLLGQRHAVLLLLTKADKLSRGQRESQLAAMIDALHSEKIQVEGVKMLSVLKGLGISDLREVILKKLPEKPAPRTGRAAESGPGGGTANR